MDSFLVDKSYLLKKYPGKGGWTYAEIPEIAQNKSNPFGWVKVSGFIDNYELKHYKLMPMGNDKLFLPVKAEIRKKIGKQAGDFVHVRLFIEETPLEIPGEIIECLKNESFNVYDTFLSFTESEQKAYIDWIYEAKKDETKVDRIVTMIKRVSQNKKFFD